MASGHGLDVGKLIVAKAGHDMIVDHADRLHHRITDRRANKLESPFEQVFAHAP